jgi:hypothetical protein
VLHGVAVAGRGALFFRCQRNIRRPGFAKGRCDALNRVTFEGVRSCTVRVATPEEQRAEIERVPDRAPRRVRLPDLMTLPEGGTPPPLPDRLPEDEDE